MKNDKYVDMFGAMYSKYFVRDVDSPTIALYKMHDGDKYCASFIPLNISDLQAILQHEAFNFTFLKTDNSHFHDTAKFGHDVSIFICASFREFVFIV